MESSRSSLNARIVIATLLAGAAGFAANWWNITLFLNVNFLFGSIFVLALTATAGVVPGTIASLIASSATYILWNHPFAIVIFTAETLFVGLLLDRRSRNIIFLDTLYWIVLGMPLVILFYFVVMGTPFAATEQLMLKQAVNGIFNSLVVATFRLLSSFIRSRRSGDHKRKVSYREAIFTIMVGLVLVPALAFLLLEIRSEHRERIESVKNRLSVMSTSAAKVLQSWLRDRTAVVRAVARDAGDLSAADRNRLQRTVDLVRIATPSFLRLGVMDRHARSVVYSPAVDSQGRSTAGLDFSDRPFYHELKRTRQTVVSDVVMGRIGVPQPILTICEPLLTGEQFRGYVAGVVNFDELRDLLKGVTAGTAGDIHLLDRRQNIVVSTSPLWASMRHFERNGPGEKTELGGGVYQWVAMPPKRTPMSERWRRSFYGVETTGGDFPWTVIVEESMAPTVDYLNQLATRSFTVMMILISAVVALSHFVSRSMVRSLTHLEEISGRLPGSLHDPAPVAWPRSMIAEVESLVTNYRVMAERLKRSFTEIRDAKISLEQSVRERTEDLTREIEERKRRERELRDAGEVLEQIFATTTTNIAYLNRDFDFIRVNNRYAVANGQEPEFFVGKNHFQLFPHEENEQIFRKVVETGEPYNVTAKPFVFPDQPERGVTYWDWSLTPVKNIHGTVDALILFLVDVTDRIRAEESLRKREREYKSLVENNPDLIVRYDRSCRHLYVNPAVERMMGKTRDEILGRGIDEFDVSRETVQTVGAMVRSVFETREEQIAELAARSVTATAHFLVRGVPEFGVTGDVQSALFIYRDVTERKLSEEERIRLEHRLQEAERLDSIGRLAGGIAHDFNNMLTPIIGYAHLALRHLGNDHPVAGNLREIVDAAARAGSLTQQILAFGRRQMLQLRVMNINREIEALQGMLTRTVREDIAIELHFGADLASIVADGAQIQQIVMNLVVNARDAMPRGGRIVMETANLELPDPPPAEFAGMRPGNYVRLTVQDDGEGMTPETLEHLFEPFYTTKAAGRGTGLGLATVHGIVKQHGGDVFVKSVPGQGTAMTILFPAVEGPPEERPSAGETLVTRTGSGTVLVVEDNQQVRDLVRIVLEEHGYAVMTAENGEAALTQAAERTIDLLITDVVMPKINGRDLYDKLSAVMPGLPVVFMSGYPASTVAGYDVELQEGANFLRKPFEPDVLLNKVRSALAGKTSRET